MTLADLKCNGHGRINGDAQAQYGRTDDVAKELKDFCLRSLMERVDFERLGW